MLSDEKAAEIKKQVLDVYFGEDSKDMKPHILALLADREERKKVIEGLKTEIWGLNTMIEQPCLVCAERNNPMSFDPVRARELYNKMNHPKTGESDPTKAKP